MKITQMKINHIDKPLGFALGEIPVLSFSVEEAKGKKQTGLNIKVFKEIDGSLLYDSGQIITVQTAYPLEARLSPRTRYRVAIEVCSDAGERASAETWFETGKMAEPWEAKWIGPEKDAFAVPVLNRNINISKPVASARAYVGCAGVYKMDINGEKTGSEYMTPYFNDYSSWMQIITHDITQSLRMGNNNIEFVLANGWYKGSFSLFRGGNIYGDRLAVIAELHIDYVDGSREVVITDKSWGVQDSAYEMAEIYDGAIINFSKEIAQPVAATVHDICTEKLMDRLSLPVCVMEELPVQKVLTTPKGETCLDLGQNMTGLLKLDTSRFANSDFKLTFFEELDRDGNVYTENLRSAKQEFIYISDGKVRIFEPEFTFYGFRYVKVEGIGEVCPEDFTGRVLYSEMAQTGFVETSNPLVNRLFLNTMWGQKGNFLDVPTDCPQRDERLGWTGDAQVFSGTAYFNMDVAAFFTKYLYDIRQEQLAADGAVPVTVPSCTPKDGVGIMKSGVAAWGDAATVIPWNNYLHTGDKEVLKLQYPLMKDWVEYIRGKDSGSRLWDSGFQLGDWLALDTPPDSKLGLTPETLVASAYYLYSAALTAKAANALGYKGDVNKYAVLAEEIREAIRYEFVTPSGRIGSDTQTADVLALQTGFAVDSVKTAGSLENKILKKYGGHLSTGFVGTAFLCRALSDNGHNDTAYSLLMNKDYPGWLYEVEKGATTIWERWDSIKPDGSFGNAEMNSFNHYSYGAVMEWVYRNAAGLQPCEDAPGFRKVRYAPQPDARIEWLKASYNSICGVYKSEWKITKECLKFKLTVPFGGSAILNLPHAPEKITMNGKEICYAIGIELAAGEYAISYRPTIAYYITYSLDTDIAAVLGHSKLMAQLLQIIPEFSGINPVLSDTASGSLRDLLKKADIPVSDEKESKLLYAWETIHPWDI